MAVLIHRARQASAFEERSVDEVRDAAGRGARHEPPEMHVGLPDVRGRPGLEGRCEVEADLGHVPDLSEPLRIRVLHGLAVMADCVRSATLGSRDLPPSGPDAPLPAQV